MMEILICIRYGIIYNYSMILNLFKFHGNFDETLLTYCC